MSSTLSPRVVHRLLLAGCALWLGAIVFAPIAATRDLAVAPWLYLFFDPVCHQISERSFHVARHALAVCHRCSGLYVGFSLGLLLVPRTDRIRTWLLDQPRRTLYFAVPMLIDWTLPMNIAASRFGTGLLAAAPIAALIWAAVVQTYKSRPTTVLEGKI